MTFQAWPKRLPCLHLLSNRKARVHTHISVSRISHWWSAWCPFLSRFLRTPRRWIQSMIGTQGTGRLSECWQKLGRGASWLISVMIPANLTMKSAFGTNMRFCPLNSDANEIQMWIVTLVNVAVLVRRKVNASVANFKNSSGFSRDS